MEVGRCSGRGNIGSGVVGFLGRGANAPRSRGSCGNLVGSAWEGRGWWGFDLTLQNRVDGKMPLNAAIELPSQRNTGPPACTVTVLLAPRQHLRPLCTVPSSTGRSAPPPRCGSAPIVGFRKTAVEACEACEACFPRPLRLVPPAGREQPRLADSKNRAVLIQTLCATRPSSFNATLHHSTRLQDGESASLGRMGASCLAGSCRPAPSENW